MNRYSLLVVAAILTAMVWPLDEVTKIIEASPIKNWTSNEQITYTDLNNNFNHLHANLGHGHGPIITANDIASNAGIRPEQTTFGSSINRSLVFEGTFQENPDAGTIYIPLNYVGAQGVTVTEITGGFQIDGTVAAGSLTDAGTNIYTVFYKAVRLGAHPFIACSDSTATSVSMVSPFQVKVLCVDLLTLDTGPVTYTIPSGVAIMVFNNKVQ